jgi:hypothetical protein
LLDGTQPRVVPRCHGGSSNLITADVSLVSEIDKVVNAITQKEIKLDILFMPAGFMVFEGLKDTREGQVPIGLDWCSEASRCSWEAATCGRATE